MAKQKKCAWQVLPSNMALYDDVYTMQYQAFKGTGIFKIQKENKLIFYSSQT